MSRRLLFLGILFFLAIAGIWISFRLTSPSKSSFHLLGEIKEPVQVEWDKADIPTIQAADIQDAYFIQGFLTARERFFQMELTRRKMSGRLAEIFGAKAVDSDVKARKWNFSKAAQVSFAQMDPSKREPLISYAAGVNAFLKDQSPSWEFLALGLTPSFWRPEDSFLIVLSMYENLNRHDESDEEVVALLRGKLPPPVTTFLTLDWGILDAPIVKDFNLLSPPAPPTEREFRITVKEALNSVSREDFEPGSNAWVMSGKLTQTGKPLLASDPHLDLRVPNLWYRLGIKTPNHFIYGATIPGVPGIVIGRNEQVAWAFTNSAVDNADQIIVPKNSKELRIREEEILVKGEQPHHASFKDTPWGPIVSSEGDQLIAVQWTALDPGNLKNLDLSSINQARDWSELVEALGKWAGPPQNAVFATQAGDIGWTIAGNLPKRVGFDGKSRTIRSKSIFWDGYISRREFPLVLNPPEGFIVSANQRTVPPQGPLSKFGSHWPNSARAKRITELLKQKRRWRSSDFLQVQTDNLSLTHLWYQKALESCPLNALNENDLRWLKPSFELIKDWNGRTDINSSAYPLIKVFRTKLFSNLIGPIAKTVSLNQAEAVLKYLSRDNLAFELIRRQPKNFLPPHFNSYCDLLTQTLKEAAQSLVDKPQLLPSLRWGSMNQSDVQHPFTRLFPSVLRALINMPTQAMPGDSLVPNVMTPRNGASMRLVIDFSDKAQSLFSQPGGQSGHPFSSHYSDLFGPWVDGKSVPFESQGTVLVERFSPKRSHE